MGRESIAKLCDALLDNNADCKLVDLELAKCNITSTCAKHLIKLMSSKIKLRHLNLKDNTIQDDAASEMLAALVHHNNYITRLNIDYNPVRHQLLRDIDAQTKLNVLKVNAQEMPMMVQEINEIKTRTALVLYECSTDPLLKGKMMEIFSPETLDVLKRIHRSNASNIHKQPNGTRQPSQKEGHNRIRLEGVSKAERKALYGGRMFTSCEVVQLYTYINSLKRHLQDQKDHLFEQFNAYDEEREQMLAEARAVFSEF